MNGVKARGVNFKGLCDNTKLECLIHGKVLLTGGRLTGRPHIRSLSHQVI
jgi:hypothetical protein